MRCVIQTIPERLKFARLQAEKLGVHCDRWVDAEKKGPFLGFIDSLNFCPSGDEYRLHMQDDIIFCDDFVDYLPTLEEMMRKKEINLLSLFAPRRKHMRVQFEKGKRIGSFPNFLWMQCVIMSPLMVSRLKEHAHQYDDKHDDVYVNAVLRAYKDKAFVHLPSLVQHDIGIPSSMGHANNDKRTSELFDPHFVTKWKNQQQ